MDEYQRRLLSDLTRAIEAAEKFSLDVNNAAYVVGWLISTTEAPSEQQNELLERVHPGAAPSERGK